MHIYIYTETDVIFIIGEWNAKVGSQEIPGVTGKFGFGRSGHSKHPLPKTQETTIHMDITKWSILKSD